MIKIFYEIRNETFMKTAKDILREKNYKKFDSEKAFNEIEKFFSENEANAKLVLMAKNHDSEIEDSERDGFEICVNDEVLDYVFRRDNKDLKISSQDISRGIAIMKVDPSVIERIKDILKENKFYVERASNGVYHVTLL